MTSRRDDTPWCHDITPYHNKTFPIEFLLVNPSESLKIPFFSLVTLTFDLWPWSSNSSEISSRSTPAPNFGFVHQTVHSWERWLTDTHTDTQTDTQTGLILYPRPLTREGMTKKILTSFRKTLEDNSSLTTLRFKGQPDFEFFKKIWNG